MLLQSQAVEFRGSKRTVHDAQAKVEEQASYVAAEPGRIRT